MKPGVMIYLDILPTLELLSNEEAGELFKAAVHYAAGELPEITLEKVRKIWPRVKIRIEADNRAYFEKTRNSQFAVFHRDNPGITRKQWEATYSPARYLTLDEIIAGEEAQEPPEPPQAAPEPENTTTTLNAALARWISYRGYAPEQVALERPRFEALRREHGAAAVAVAVDRAISTNAKTITIEEETK